MRTWRMILLVVVALIMLASLEPLALLRAQPQNYTVIMTPAETTVRPGEPFTLTISVTNNGQTDNTGGQIDFYLPENQLVIDEVLDGGRQLISAPFVVTWEVPEGFEANTTITKRVVVKVPPSSFGVASVSTPAQVMSFKIRDYWYADLRTDHKYIGSEAQVTVDLRPGAQIPRSALPLVVR